eukprot:COSAG03_NODE_18036_length_363_cov_0.806818_1_plen_101_part_10
MTSLLDLLDHPPDASPAGSNGQGGGENSANTRTAGMQNGQTETLEDFSPALRDRGARDEETGSTAGTGQAHSKVRGRLTDSIEDGRSIGTRGGPSFGGKPL